MTSKAFLFPGQGSQSVGMLAELSQQFSKVISLFNDASDILHYDLWELTQKGPTEQLNKTEFTQPALLAAGVAVWQCWQEQSQEKPQFFAGHSLGEYTALVCAESLSFHDAIELVALRGKYMQAAVAEGEGAMAAIIGLDNKTVEEICASIDGVVSPANYNAIGQVVIAGLNDAVEEAMKIAKEKGAKMAVKIPVSVPSHCSLMQSASEKLAEKLNGITIKKPMIPVVQNVDVKIHETPDAIREALIQQLTSPVRWVETIQYLIKNNVKEFYECGPGNVLAGLNKRIDSSVSVKSVVKGLEGV